MPGIRVANNVQPWQPHHASGGGLRSRGCGVTPQQMPLFGGPRSVWKYDVTGMAAAVGAELAEQNASKLADQANASNLGFDVTTPLNTGAPRFLYPGVAYYGTTSGRRSQLKWENYVQPLYKMGPLQALRRIWLVTSNETEVLRIRTANASLQAPFEAVPWPNHLDLVAGQFTFKAEITELGKLSVITGFPTNRGLKNNGNAMLVTGPGLPAGGSLLGTCTATTATLLPAAESLQGQQTYTAYGLLGSGTDRHLMVHKPSTDEYWELWGVGVFAADCVQAKMSIAGAEPTVLKGIPSFAGLVSGVTTISGPGLTGSLTLSNFNEAAGTATMSGSASGSQVEQIYTIAGGRFAKAGEWKFGYGAYLSGVSRSNGTVPHGWGARAVDLAGVGGNITFDDLIRVARGGEINHALGISLVAASGGGALPATRGDKQEISETGGAEKVGAVVPTFNAKAIAGGKLEVQSGGSELLYLTVGSLLKAQAGIVAANAKVTTIAGKVLTIEPAAEKTEATTKAYGIVNPSVGQDAVKEGTRYRMPVDATTAGINRATEPIMWAIFQAAYRYGFITWDRTSDPLSISLLDARLLRSKYMRPLDPLAGYTGVVGNAKPTAAELKAYANPLELAVGVDPGLAAVIDNFEGSPSALQNSSVWQRLEQVAAVAAIP